MTRAQEIEDALTLVYDLLAESIGTTKQYDFDTRARFGIERAKRALALAPVAGEAVAWCARRSDGTLVYSSDDELPTTTIPDHVGWTRGLDMAYPMFAPHTLVPLAPVEPTR